MTAKGKDKNTGILYAVGAGPGDPELLTLKAVRILNECRHIVVPRGKQEGRSLALSIIEKAVGLDGKNKNIIEMHFPMVKDKEKVSEALRGQAGAVLNILQAGEDVAFVTLGDPTLYSTFFRLYDTMLDIAPQAGLKGEIIPGVSSVTATAARAGRCLAVSDEKVAILPAVYIKDIGDVLEGFETVVLMKVHSVFEEVKKTLSEAGLLEAAVYVSEAGLPGETIKPLHLVASEELNYFSTVIITKGKTLIINKGKTP